MKRTFEGEVEREMHAMIAILGPVGGPARVTTVGSTWPTGGRIWRGPA